MLVAKYKVKFWANQSGEKPVACWLKSLSPQDKEYFGGLLRDLAFDGPFHRPKVFKHIDKSLWEIRDLRSPGPGFRVYFGFNGSAICLIVASGDKKSQQRDIERVKKILDNNKEDLI